MDASAVPLLPGTSLRVSENPPPGGEFRLRVVVRSPTVGSLSTSHTQETPTGSGCARWMNCRRVSSLEPRETYPFWSADSRSIGFFAAGKLKRVDVGGGSPAELCAVTGGRGGTWSANGVILFNGYNDGPIMQVSASGGEPVAVTNIDQSRSENSHRWPQFLPDGRRFLYFVRADNPQVRGVYVSALIVPPRRLDCSDPPRPGMPGEGRRGRVSSLGARRSTRRATV